MRETRFMFPQRSQDPTPSFWCAATISVASVMNTPVRSRPDDWASLSVFGYLANTQTKQFRERFANLRGYCPVFYSDQQP